MFSEFLSELRHRARAIVRRDAMEHDLDEELRFHVEREAEKLVRAGLSREDAVRHARITFGGVERIKEDTRDARGISLLEHVIQDTRYALRGLRARPMFTAAVIITLAVGVGVNAAMFGILDRAFFRPPRYLIDPSSVSRVYLQWQGSDGKRGFDRSVAYRTYTDLAHWSRSVSQLAAVAFRTMAVGDGDETKSLQVGIVSASFFDFFDARPILGRFFGAQEDSTPAGDAVVVLSHAFWQARYAGRQDILGATLRIGKAVYKVIGVAPPGFTATTDQRAPVVYVPVTAFAATVNRDFYKNYAWSWIEVLVRRRPGVTLDAATADLTNANLLSWNAERVLEPNLPAASAVHPIAVAAPIQLARGPMAGPETKVVVWIGAVAVVVLLISCANVANLLLARALRRRREMAVRRAIGGTRRRLMQQMLTETVVLAALGSAAGLLGAQLAGGGLRRLLVAADDPWPVATDGRTLLFAGALTIITALFAGLLPALHAGGGDLAGSLKAGTREGAYRQSRLRTTLLLFQTALSVVLLVGAGLFVRSLQQVRALPLGYDLDHLMYVEMSMRGVSLNGPEAVGLTNRLLAESRAIPGVASASLIESVPFYSGESRGLWVVGIDSVRKLGRFQLQAGSPDYFATTGTRILRGRGYTADDRAGRPLVAIVSEAMAKALWKDENALGKCFHIGSDTMPCTTVIGIAENTKARNITGDGEFMYYLPMAQYLVTLGQPSMLALFVRVGGRPEDFVEPTRSRLQRLMPGPAFVTTQPFHQIVDPTMRSWTSGARMFLAFGAMALVLAAIGLYAVISFAVAQRTQELGVRVALGARGVDLLRLVVGEGVRVTVGGVAIGIVFALVASKGIGELLFGVSSRDPLVFSIVALTLIAVGVLASAIPASRASRVDPNVALRAE
jgi:putative ABC transport system permease protein